MTLNFDDELTEETSILLVKDFHKLEKNINNLLNKIFKFKLPNEINFVIDYDSNALMPVLPYLMLHC